MAYDIIVGRDDHDKKIFTDKGLTFIGKGYVKMGQYTSLSNRLFMDVARSHVVLVAGKRGSGKCLHEDTLVSLADGSQVPIKKLKDNHEKIMSLNNKLKINPAKKTEFFSRQVKKLLKIKLRSGKEIKLTPEHPLLTINGWQPAENLTQGNRIATPRKIDSFGTHSLPEYEIKLLAYLLAEGHTKSVVLFSNSDQKIINDFRSSLKALDKNLQLVKDKEYHYRIVFPGWKNKIIIKDGKRNQKGQFLKGSKNVLKKRTIRELIEREEMYGVLAKNKYLSKNIMQLEKDSLALFLNRIFSCDGSLYKINNYWEGSYSSSSKKLIKQIHSLLLKFGILSKIRDKKIIHKGKKFDSYEIVINSKNLVKFIEEIGFFGGKKEKEFIAKQEILSKKRNPNIDTIPKEIWDNYRPENWSKIGKAIGYKHPKAMRERIRYSPSRQTLIQIAEIEKNEELKMLAESDIFWDEISSIKELKGNFTVYDITVPENHNFVANDIIVHNSYTLGVLAEELSAIPKETSQNIASLIFDTMGIYWTMKYINEKDKPLLKEWGLKPKRLPVKVFVPFGHYELYREKGIPVDDIFALDVMELEPEDWVTTFNLKITEPTAVLITRTMIQLKQKRRFDIDDIINAIKADKQTDLHTKNSAMSLFEAAKAWGIFATKNEKPTQVKELLTAATTSVLDLSVYNSVGSFNVRALAISLISKKIFNQRMQERKQEEINSISKGLSHSYNDSGESPMIWMFIDEAHEFLPLNGKTIATDALVQLLREGRQPGISLVLATQQPGQINHDVMTQSDLVISHRVTSKPDLDALNYIMQSYLIDSIKKYMDDLPNLKGSAIILDDNSERIYPMRIRPRFTWHGGESPTSVQPDKRL